MRRSKDGLPRKERFLSFNLSRSNTSCSWPILLRIESRIPTYSNSSASTETKAFLPEPSYRGQQRKIKIKGSNVLFLTKKYTKILMHKRNKRKKKNSCKIGGYKTSRTHCSLLTNLLFSVINLVCKVKATFLLTDV